MKPIGELLQIRASFRVTVSLLLFGVAAIFVTAYHFRPDWRETLRFAGAAIGVAGGLQSAYLAQRALSATVEDRQLTAACEYFARFYGPDTKPLRDKMRVFSGLVAGKSGPEIAQMISASAEHRDHVNQLLNFFEEVGYAAKRDKIDAMMVGDLMGTAIRTTYTNLQPWLGEYRRQNSQPTAWEHFEWLCNRLNKRG